MVWPRAAIFRTISGWAEALRPIRKNVASTHSCASAASTFGVVPGQGPSSKVSTTSWSASGSVCGKLFRPTRGEVAASTVSTREVPSASLRGHSAASAALQAIAAARVAPIARMNFEAIRRSTSLALRRALPIG